VGRSPGRSTATYTTVLSLSTEKPCVSCVPYMPHKLCGTLDSKPGARLCSFIAFFKIVSNPFRLLIYCVSQISVEAIQNPDRITTDFPPCSFVVSGVLSKRGAEQPERSVLFLVLFKLVKLVNPSFHLCAPEQISGSLSLCFHAVQIPVELVEYSVNAVSEGIDSVAQTRVVIRSLNDAGNSQIHSQTGAEVHRSFRWGSSLLTLVFTEICDSCVLKTFA
jgi:hypothetical protein